MVQDIKQWWKETGIGIETTVQIVFLLCQNFDGPLRKLEKTQRQRRERQTQQTAIFI